MCTARFRFPIITPSLLKKQTSFFMLSASKSNMRAFLTQTRVVAQAPSLMQSSAAVAVSPPPLPSVAAAAATPSPSTKMQVSPPSSSTAGASSSSSSSSRNNDIVAAAFYRLLSLPSYQYSALRSSSINAAVTSITAPGAPEVTAKNLVLDRHRALPPAPPPSPPPPEGTAATATAGAGAASGASYITSVAAKAVATATAAKTSGGGEGNDYRRYPGLGMGLRRLALEALDPNILSYVSSLNDPIPHDEVAEHVERVKAACKSLNGDFRVCAVGSHRRGAMVSRTVDVLITAPPSALATSGREAPPPALVLMKLKRLLQASGYMIAATTQQAADSGSGVATMTAVCQLLPPLRSLLPNQNNKNMRDMNNNNAKEQQQPPQQDQDQEASTAVQQMLLRDFGSSPVAALSAWTEHDKKMMMSSGDSNGGGGGGVDRSEAIKQREETNRRHLQLEMDLSRGVLPQVTSRSETLMEKLLRMSERQRSKMKKKTTDDPAISSASASAIAGHVKKSANTETKNNEDDDDANDEEVAEVQQALCAMEAARGVRTTKDVLRRIVTDQEEEDVDHQEAAPATGNVTQSQQQKQQPEPEPKRQPHPEATSTTTTTTTTTTVTSPPCSTLKASADDKRDAQQIEQLLEDLAAQQKHSHKSDVRRATMRSLALQQLEDGGAQDGRENSNNDHDDDDDDGSGNSSSNISNNNNRAIYAFPCDTRRLPRKVNLVWVPDPSQFIGLQLLLTGPPEFGAFVQDRAKRFGFRLENDGKWTCVDGEMTDDEKAFLLEKAIVGGGRPVSAATGVSSFTRHQMESQHSSARGGAGMKRQTYRPTIAQALEKGREAAIQAQQERLGRVRRQNLMLKQDRVQPLSSEADIFRKLDMTFVAPLDR